MNPTTMLVGIEWDIHTSNEAYAGTDTEIDCEVMRDNAVIVAAILEPGKTP